MSGLSLKADIVAGSAQVVEASHRWGVRMLLDSGIHMIPWLRARGENIHSRSIDGWISQTCCLQAQNVRQPFQFHRHLATAIRTKPTFDSLAGSTDDFVITRLSIDLNGRSRHHDDCSVSASTCLLAVSTMTVQHKDWIGAAFAMDRATGAPA